MAWEQEAALHGPNHVYADIDGFRHWNGGGQFTVPTYFADNGEPDLLADNVDTPEGPGFAVWDVKVGNAKYGRSYNKSIDKLGGYIVALQEESGLLAVPGAPIVPEMRFYPN
jgi:hypothetical protein